MSLRFGFGRSVCIATGSGGDAVAGGELAHMRR